MELLPADCPGSLLHACSEFSVFSLCPPSLLCVGSAIDWSVGPTAIVLSCVPPLVDVQFLVLGSGHYISGTVLGVQGAP